MPMDSDTETAFRGAAHAQLLVDAAGVVQSLNPAAEELLGCSERDAVGCGMCRLMLALPVWWRRRPAGIPCSSSNTSAPSADAPAGAQCREPAFSLLAHIERVTSSGNRITLYRRTPARVNPAAGPAPSAAPGIVNRRLAAVNELLMRASMNVPLKEKLEHILDMILALPGFPADIQGVILLADRDGGLALRVARGAPPDPLQRALGTCLCGNIATTGGGAHGSPPDPICTVPHHGGHDTHQYIVPMVNDERLVGMLALSLRPGHQWEQPEEEFLGIVAGLLAMIIDPRCNQQENLRLLDENRRLNRRLLNVQEEEQRRLARELHDEMGQSLTAIKANATFIANRTADPGSPLAESAKAIVASADRLYDMTHGMIRKLRPNALDDLGLVAAFESYVRDWRALRPGTRCTFAAEGDIEGLGEEINITLYRVMQECLTNVVRHAAASRVQVVLRRWRGRRGRDEVYLQVSDDGRGMSPRAIKTKGRFGLLGIRERAEGQGGRLVLEGGPGQGLSVTVYLPVGESSSDG